MQDTDERDQSARQQHRAATELTTEQHPVSTAPRMAHCHSRSTQIILNQTKQQAWGSSRNQYIIKENIKNCGCLQLMSSPIEIVVN